MRVFVTGATGFIGSAIVQELINAGHKVTGLARSAASAAKLIAAGAAVHQGDLEDLESLRSGASAADAVIHAGFIHDFTRFAEVCEVDKLAIRTLAEILAGSDRPLIVTSGTALVSPGSLATEDIIATFNPLFPRASELEADAFASRGVRAASIRLSPSVHGEGDLRGFIPTMINIAREKGFAAYIGDGLNRWNAVHRLDAAHLFRLAVENATAGTKYHAVGDESIQVKTIAEAIGKGLNLPVRAISRQEAGEHFGWFSGFASIDCPASSKLTQERLSWHPHHPSLLSDLENSFYFKS